MQDEAEALPRVVCVHGAGAGGWEWAIWARVLAARGFDVLAPDLMPREAGLAATQFDDYRAQVLDWCGGERMRPILLGASLGGLLALATAKATGAKALVLVNPVPPAGGPLLPRAQPHGAVVPWGSRRSIGGTCRAMPQADDAARLFAFRRWRDESGAVLDAARAGVAVDAPSCRVFVLASELDADVPAATSRALADRLGADFERIDAAGHVDPLLGRDAARIAMRVADWLQARAGSTAI